jgi:diadenosine tetraphosphate (Ap4A) HIT family hydrolase
VKPLTLGEIVPLEAYGPLRAAYRERVIAHKRHRRLALGEQATLLFEDRETLRFQVQEMLWVERIADPTRIQAELDVYNPLMPGDGELSATLFLEVTEPAQIRPTLDRLVGIDRHVGLVLGEGEDERALPAVFDAGQFEADRIAAVQYLRFRLDPRDRERLADPCQRARVRCTHPGYRREDELPTALRRALVDSLGCEPEPLLRPSGAPAAPARLLFETPHVRARFAPGSADFAHVIVEPVAAVASLLEADAPLAGELLEAVQRVAAELVARHAGCRIETEVGGAPGLRWHVIAHSA